MNTSPQTSLITEVLSDRPLGAGNLGYVHGLVRNRAHICVLNIFASEQKERGLTKAQIARKLNKRPEVVSRELTAPGNWTLDTYANYLIAMGYLPTFSAQDIRNPQPMPNRVHPLADGLTMPILQAAVTASAGQVISRPITETSGNVQITTPAIGTVYKVPSKNR